MEILKISKTAIKFSLTREELSLRGLSAEALDKTTTGAKRLIWELMDRARVEQGFDCGDARLLVRVFPSRDGGCELFVTSEKEEERKENEEEEEKEEEEERNDERARSLPRAVLLLPESDEALFSLCRRMKASGFRGKSELFADEQNRLLLLFEPCGRLPSYIQEQREKRTARAFSFVGEYGTVFAASEERRAYLAEHARSVCGKNAVETLSRIGAGEEF